MMVLMPAFRQIKLIQYIVGPLLYFTIIEAHIFQVKGNFVFYRISEEMVVGILKDKADLPS